MHAYSTQNWRVHSSIAIPNLRACSSIASPCLVSQSCGTVFWMLFSVSSSRKSRNTLLTPIQLSLVISLVGSACHQPRICSHTIRESGPISAPVNSSSASSDIELSGHENANKPIGLNYPARFDQAVHERHTNHLDQALLPAAKSLAAVNHD